MAAENNAATHCLLFDVLEPRLLLDAAPDYLIVAAHAFFDAQGNVCASIQEFADWKQLKGLPTQVVDINDIGDEASELARFIKFGSSQPNEIVWQTPPQYVLLVGDSSQVPTWQVGTLEYDPPEDPRPATHVSDNPYADCLDGNGDPGADGFADLAIGRIPVSTVADAATVINRKTWGRYPGFNRENLGTTWENLGKPGENLGTLPRF